MSAPIPVIIDTDPGQDDAVAILLALASPEIEVLGIGCVAGNVPLAATVRNALTTVELSGRDVAVRAGCDRPMARPLITAEHVHGDTGLDGFALPPPARGAAEGHAVAWMADTLRAAPRPVALCPLGPLTNIGTLLRDHPDVAPKISRIVMMGGAYFEVGNITPAAEFNVHVDPEAARIVFASGVPITVASLDVSHRFLTTRARVEAIEAAGRVGPAVAGWLRFFDRFDRDKYGTEGGPLHDPLTILWLLRPDLFTGRDVAVEIECEGTHTLGMTVADWWGVTGKPPNAHWLGTVDADRGYAVLAERLGRL